MPIRTLQRKGYQIGRIRTGVKVAAGDPKKRARPKKIETFRFTTDALHIAEQIAELYGGTAREWVDPDGGRTPEKYEVITDTDRITVVVPPRDEVISQWYEFWTKAGLQRRCDGITQRSGEPCVCPFKTGEDGERVADVEEFKASRDACSMKTRLSVMIPELKGLGVWRLDSGSYYAAAEMADVAEGMQAARDKQIFLLATLHLQERVEVKNGETSKYNVPVLDVLNSPMEIARGELSQAGWVGQLTSEMGRKQLAATSPQRLQLTAAPEPEVSRAAAERAQQRGHRPGQTVRQVTAQDLADRAACAGTRALVQDVIGVAKGHQLGEDMVRTSGPGEPEVWEELKAYLKTRWSELPE